MMVFGLASSAALLVVGFLLFIGNLVGGGGGCGEHYLVEIHLRMDDTSRDLESGVAAEPPEDEMIGY